jgi:hypothetical protein
MQQVEAIAAAIGTAVRFEELSREQALSEMSQRMPTAIALKLLDYMAKSVHTPPLVTADVERVLGRAARPFAQWAHDHAEAFRRR